MLIVAIMDGQVMQKSKQDVRTDFEARGETVTQWAKKRGYSRSLVHAVLSGQIKGIRGKSHLIAVELGLKANPSESEVH